MSSQSSVIDPRVRLAIANWDEDAPRGAVSAFCAEHGISRKSFYVLRRRAREEGQAAVLAPKSRRPKTSPTSLDPSALQFALGVRESLKESGWDYGPISVHDKMKAMGLDTPSIASLARYFHAQGVVEANAKKRPRASYRRFVYPLPNACWQLDATEWVLNKGRKCVIFQLEDDHSRLAIASLAASSENATAAVKVFKKGIAAYGIPQRLLTDNGAALNPQRRGFLGRLSRYAQSLGVETITGKPYKPTTQGKNERFHQTLFRWLNTQPLVDTLDQLQAQLDHFDALYNDRPHQGLPQRQTPNQVWKASPLACPPQPRLSPAPTDPASTPTQTQPASPRSEGIDQRIPGQRLQTVYQTGTICVNDTLYYAANSLSRHDVIVSWDENGIIITTITSEIIAEYDWAPPKTKYVGKSKARYYKTPTLQPQVSPMS